MFQKVTTLDGNHQQSFADAVFNYLNRTSCFKPFVTEMAGRHRTIQQCMTKLCIAWIEHLATLDSHQYDLRNAASVSFAKIVTDTPQWKSTRNLPCI